MFSVFSWCSGMEVFLPRVANCGRTLSITPVATRSFSISLRSGSRVAQKQRTLAPARDSSILPIWQQQKRLSSSSLPVRNISQQDPEEELSEFQRDIEAEKEKQARTPWHREGVDQPPVSRPRSASAMTRGNICISKYCREETNSR